VGEEGKVLGEEGEMEMKNETNKFGFQGFVSFFSFFKKENN
jgi:hypothetical protein